jgi:hypothetical protein
MVITVMGHNGVAVSGFVAIGMQLPNLWTKRWPIAVPCKMNRDRGARHPLGEQTKPTLVTP